MTNTVLLFLLNVLIQMSLGGKVSCARSASWDLWFSIRESLSRSWFRRLRKCLRVFPAVMRAVPSPRRLQGSKYPDYYWKHRG